MSGIVYLVLLVLAHFGVVDGPSEEEGPTDWRLLLRILAGGAGVVALGVFMFVVLAYFAQAESYDR